MSIIISTLCSHLIAVLEKILLKEEPVIVNLAVKEIELLITKLDNLIHGKKIPMVPENK